MFIPHTSYLESISHQIHYSYITCCPLVKKKGYTSNMQPHTVSSASCAWTTFMVMINKYISTSFVVIIHFTLTLLMYKSWCTYVDQTIKDCSSLAWKNNYVGYLMFCCKITTDLEPTSYINYFNQQGWWSYAHTFTNSFFVICTICTIKKYNQIVQHAKKELVIWSLDAYDDKVLIIKDCTRWFFGDQLRWSNH